MSPEFQAVRVCFMASFDVRLRLLQQHLALLPQVPPRMSFVPGLESLQLATQGLSRRQRQGWVHGHLCGLGGQPSWVLLFLSGENSDGM